MGAYESGQAFLAGVLAKLPEESRAQAKELFEKPEAKDAIVLIGDGAMARPDYSKAMDTLTKQQAEAAAEKAKFEDLFARNQAWWEDNQRVIEDYKVIKPEYDTLKGTRSEKKDDKVVDPYEAARKVVDEVAPGYVSVNNWVTIKALEHLKNFGEVPDGTIFDPQQNPKLGKPIAGQPGRVYSLQDAYNEKYGTLVKEKAQKDEDARIAKLVDAGIAEKLKGQVNQPFPMRNAELSVLDVLDDKDRATKYSSDEATAFYRSLQDARST